MVRREMIKLCTFLSVPWEFDVNLVMVTNFFSYVSVFNSCSEYNDCNIFGLKFTGWTHRRKGKHFNELRSYIIFINNGTIYSELVAVKLSMIVFKSSSMLSFIAIILM